MSKSIVFAATAAAAIVVGFPAIASAQPHDTAGSDRVATAEHQSANNNVGDADHSDAAARDRQYDRKCDQDNNDPARFYCQVN